MAWIIVMLWLDSCAGDIVGQHYMVAYVGQKQQLECCPTVVGPVDWHYQRRGSLPVVLYSAGTLSVHLVHKYTVITSVAGCYNLVIISVQHSDAGDYTCVEDGGMGKTVLDITLAVIDIQMLNVTTGGVAELPCFTNFNETVDWHYYHTIGTLPSVVCAEGQIPVSQRMKFSLNTTNGGHSSLIIRDTKPSDGGLYHCIGQGGLGSLIAVVHLTVSDMVPNMMPITSLLSSEVDDIVMGQEAANHGYVATIIGVTASVFVFIICSAIFMIVYMVKSKQQGSHEDIINLLERGDIHVERCQLIGQLHTNGLVWGITELNDKIYVLTYESNTVQVYAALEPFGNLHPIVVDGLQGPRDITCYKAKHMLYIADYISACLWKIDTSEAAKMSISKIVVQKERPQSLSMYSDRLLVVTKHQLLIYALDGRLQKTINLPEFMYAQHALQIIPDTFIVCHVGSKATNNRDIGVSKVDDQGHVLLKYNYQRQGEFLRPWHMASYTDGSVLVAHQHSRPVILSLSAEDGRRFDLKLSEETGHEPATCATARIHYVQDSGRLFITGENCVFIYSLLSQLP